ncbi:hypothetical protein BMS3Abin17_00110 [archaeon BMS3Abin17]|nr:hypothetical protein BMS3Abin17_00110 [archaeon BMS3Abin17]HDZ60148.1 hypothetical protein [Candidatus Pacearchaeota archaeon]
MMNKKGLVGIILFILIIVCIFLLTLYIFHLKWDKNCLEKTAKKVCEDKGYTYESFFIGDKLSPRMICSENERDIKKIYYRFLTKELEECKR